MQIEDAEAPLAGAETFDEQRREKWEMGAIERRANVLLGCLTDPAERVIRSCFDLANDADQLLERGEIGMPEAQRLYDMSMDIYLFSKSVIARRVAG